jgi:hypothetical protein
MWEARNRRIRDRRLEARLRSARPEADEALVRNIAGALESPGRPRAWSRLAFAAAFTTFLVGSFASFGGISYAASGATNAVHTLTKIATTKPIIVHHSAAADQYNPPAPPENNQGQGGTQGGTQGAQAAQGVEAETSALPFTGLSLLATTLLGLAMIMTGLALRRRERRKS